MMKLQANQCVIDACLQLEGTEEALFELADRNGAGITEVLEAGREMVGLRRPRGAREKAAVTALTRRPPASFFKSSEEEDGWGWN